jgi:hypothetical protein
MQARHGTALGHTHTTQPVAYGLFGRALLAPDSSKTDSDLIFFSKTLFDSSVPPWI